VIIYLPEIVVLFSGFRDFSVIFVYFRGKEEIPRKGIRVLIIW
jgi:hypothetical protein